MPKYVAPINKPFWWFFMSKITHLGTLYNNNSGYKNDQNII